MYYEIMRKSSIYLFLRKISECYRKFRKWNIKELTILNWLNVYTQKIRLFKVSQDEHQEWKHLLLL